jgi:hypothetical protein
LLGVRFETLRARVARALPVLRRCLEGKGWHVNDSNDYEWLLARERGEDVSHIPAETRAKYRQLDRLLNQLPTHAPSPGWKQRVLDSLDDPGLANADVTVISVVRPRP